MEKEVKDIHVQKLTTKTEWDDDKRVLITTIQVKTIMPVDTLIELLALQKMDAPLYITIGSDQQIFGVQPEVVPEWE